MKPKIIIKNPFTDSSNYEVVTKSKYILKAETETTTEPKLVVGIKTPLNIIFITLQNRRERNQNGLSKQSASATPPFIKGTQWAKRIQEFEK